MLHYSLMRCSEVYSVRQLAAVMSFESSRPYPGEGDLRLCSKIPGHDSRTCMSCFSCHFCRSVGIPGRGGEEMHSLRTDGKPSYKVPPPYRIWGSNL